MDSSSEADSRHSRPRPENVPKLLLQMSRPYFLTTHRTQGPTQDLKKDSHPHSRTAILSRGDRRVKAQFPRLGMHPTSEAPAAEGSTINKIVISDSWFPLVGISPGVRHGRSAVRLWHARADSRMLATGGEGISVHRQIADAPSDGAAYNHPTEGREQVANA